MKLAFALIQFIVVNQLVFAEFDRVSPIQSEDAQKISEAQKILGDNFLESTCSDSFTVNSFKLALKETINKRNEDLQRTAFFTEELFSVLKSGAKDAKAVMEGLKLSKKKDLDRANEEVAILRKEGGAKAYLEKLKKDLSYDIDLMRRGQEIDKVKKEAVIEFLKSEFEKKKKLLDMEDATRLNQLQSRIDKRKADWDEFISFFSDESADLTKKLKSHEAIFLTLHNKLDALKNTLHVLENAENSMRKSTDNLNKKLIALKRLGDPRNETALNAGKDLSTRIVSIPCDELEQKGPWGIFEKMSLHYKEVEKFIKGADERLKAIREESKSDDSIPNRKGSGPGSLPKNHSLPNRP